MANQAKLLLFHMAPDKTKQIETICQTLNLQVIKVKPGAYCQKLGYLAGISGFPRENMTYSGQEFPSEMLVFSGMDSEMVDCFLAKYKETAISPIHLKAILTPHNIFWTAEALYKELAKEHQNFVPVGQ